MWSSSKYGSRLHIRTSYPQMALVCGVSCTRKVSHNTCTCSRNGDDRELSYLNWSDRQIDSPVIWLDLMWAYEPRRKARRFVDTYQRAVVSRNGDGGIQRMTLHSPAINNHNGRERNQLIHTEQIAHWEIVVLCTYSYLLFNISNSCQLLHVHFWPFKCLYIPALNEHYALFIT